MLVAKNKKQKNIEQKQYCNKFNKDFLNGLLKSKDFTLHAKIHIVQVMVFPLVMYTCES